MILSDLADLNVSYFHMCLESLIPGLGRSPGEGKSYRLRYSGPENSMGCIVHGVAESRTRLSAFCFHFSFLYLQNVCLCICVCACVSAEKYKQEFNTVSLQEALKRQNHLKFQISNIYAFYRQCIISREQSRYSSLMIPFGFSFVYNNIEYFLTYI